MAKAHSSRLTRRRRKLRAIARRPREVNRRQFLAQGALLVAAGAGLAAHAVGASAAPNGRVIRPPGAVADDASFRRRCVRCGLCGTVCENGGIRFHDHDDLAHGAFTPYLDLRKRSCTLCMRCTQVCPSGALIPIEDARASILAQVRMGRAFVDPEHCISYLGRLCGYCHDACPFPGTALKLTPPALPVVLDECVGCGRCVENCPQTPTAIDVRRVPT
jgi:ferredoxin